MRRDDDCTDERAGGFGDLERFFFFVLILRALAGRRWGDRACPSCAEPIRARATFCRFCRTELPQPRRARDLTVREAASLLAAGLSWAVLVCAAILAILTLTKGCY